MMSLLLLLACTSTKPDDTGDVEPSPCSDDATPPTVSHEPAEGPLPFGVDVLIEVVAQDECRIAYVWLYYRSSEDGPHDWAKVNMLPGTDTFSGTIPGEDQRGAGLDYYVEVSDLSQNVTFAPTGGVDEPFVIAFE